LICLMHETLRLAELGRVHIVLGHVGIFRSLIKAAQVSDQVESELFDALQRKAYEEVDSILDKRVDDAAIRSMLRELSRLSGDESILVTALKIFANAPAAVKKEIAELEAIAQGIKARIPQLSLGYDLCELRGYEYHTGIVFAAYTPGYGQALAQGGRYDDIGQAFGLARPASGFDSDLKVIAKLSKRNFEQTKAISAPYDADPALAIMIEQLRATGQRVIVHFDAVTSKEAMLEAGCDRQISKNNETWQVSPI
jgi:ATP phosphoribosyltransferase regulatory subunit